jgi:N-methylhydantoinase A
VRLQAFCRSGTHMLRIAFDIGGTFTDFALHDSATGHLRVGKALTTPDDLTRAVIAGITDLLDRTGTDPGALGAALHATTVATNAILERRGARTALLTTDGFRDILVMGRQKRYETFDMYLRKPAPLTRRRHVYGIVERIDAAGNEIVPLDRASVDAAAARMLADGIESAAMVFLHAYADPAHERAAAARIRELAPDLDLSLSSDVSPRIREYERASTTLANAYVKPILGRYLDRLADALEDIGIGADLHVMQSNGGLASPAVARAHPVRIVESGPAAGVLLARHVGRACGYDHVLTFDMGGTTAKLGAIDDGVPAIAPSFEVDTIDQRRYSGLPLSTPSIELLEIGAGGGSIATTDGRTIAVGPQSAGAAPGPICYGRGGTSPTVTDANLVLGYLDPGYFNGGSMTLDTAAAAAGIDRAIGRPLGLALFEAAWGIHALANASMERAMRVMSVEKGRDPRRYTLVAFGGAGPVHAARIARGLAIPRVVVPAGAGVGSAIGLLAAETRTDVTLTRIATLHPDASELIAEAYSRLETLAAPDIGRLGDPAAAVFSRYAYMRQRGQGYEIRVDLPAGPIDRSYAGRVIEAFHDAYARDYGYRDTEAGVEAVDWCLAASWPGGEASFVLDRAADGPERRIDSRRDAWFPETGGMTSCRVIDRATLAALSALSGPVIVEDPESTIVVLPGDRVSVSPRGDLVIEIAVETAA